jgi:hypothetical protein
MTLGNWFSPESPLQVLDAAVMSLNRERREIGGASGQSHFRARLSFGFEELTVAGTPNLSTLPVNVAQAIGLVINSSGCKGSHRQTIADQSAS